MFMIRDSEHKANLVLSCCLMPFRTCLISFTGPAGVRHSVEVAAESVYEAAAMRISMLRQDGWTDALAPGSKLEVQVREPATVHTVTVNQILRWVDGVAVSPDEVLKRRRVKELLARMITGARAGKQGG